MHDSLALALHRVRDTRYRRPDSSSQSHDVKQPRSSRSRGAFLRPGFFDFASLTPNRGVGGAPRNVRVLGGTPVGYAITRRTKALASPSCIADFATAFFQLREKAHVLHQKVTGNFPTARDAIRRVRRSRPLVARRTGDHCTRDLGEAIDDLYRHDAAARDHKRLLDLVQMQVERAFSLGQLCEGQRNEEGH